MMDELAEYARAELAKEYKTGDVVFHPENINQVITGVGEAYYYPCDNHPAAFAGIPDTPYGPADKTPWVRCDRLYNVANESLLRYYLVGQCPRCSRVHVFFKSEFRHVGVL